MAGGLVALLDDIATLAKAAAASVDDVAAAAGRASAKAAGVVVDDTAVTPQYLHGISPERELPIIKKIALGSLRNKILIILPIALILAEFAPYLIPVFLLTGGIYLSFEGMEKVWEKFFGSPHAQVPTLVQGVDAERQITRSAIRTDLVLSAEIMIIALAEVAREGFWARSIILIAVAFVITFLVYGLVAILVKMDDFGHALSRRSHAPTARWGRLIVAAMPHVLRTIGVVGTFAMVWVGGHLLLTSTADLGWGAPHAAVHHVASLASSVPSVGGFLFWCIETTFSLVIGALVGSVVAGLSLLVRRTRPAKHAS